jgi:hypothetical protein
MPLTIADAHLGDVAATPPTPIDAGSVRPRASHHVPTVAEPQVDAATATRSESGGPVDAGSVPDTESTVDAVPTRTAPVQPTATTRGYLRILPPQGAQILVDGVAPIGAPSRLALAQGKHRVQVSLGSSRDVFVVMIEAGEIVTLDKRDLYRARPGSDDRNHRTLNPFKGKPTHP